jgi:hypothetical protein
MYGPPTAHSVGAQRLRRVARCNVEIYSTKAKIRRRTIASFHSFDTQPSDSGLVISRIYRSPHTGISRVPWTSLSILPSITSWTRETGKTPLFASESLVKSDGGELSDFATGPSPFPDTPWQEAQDRRNSFRPAFSSGCACRTSIVPMIAEAANKAMHHVVRISLHALRVCPRGPLPSVRGNRRKSAQNWLTRSDVVSHPKSSAGKRGPFSALRNGRGAALVEEFGSVTRRFPWSVIAIEALSPMVFIHTRRIITVPGHQRLLGFLAPLFESHRRLVWVMDRPVGDRRRPSLSHTASRSILI